MGGFTPGSEEIYTLEKTLKVLQKAFDILLEDKSISLDGELGMALYKQGTCGITTLSYLFDKYKDNSDVLNYKHAILSMLEAHKCKDKGMYPGIAAMALKNKHKWQDRLEIDADIKSDNRLIIERAPEPKNEDKAQDMAG